jgi:hypothetical protein
MWGNERTRREYEPDTDTTKAIKERQTANIGPVVGTNTREDAVSVKFIKTDGISSTSAVTSDCAPDGDELESGKKDYTLNITREADIFKVKHWQAFRNNVFDPEQVIAKGLMKQRKLLDDYINQTVLTLLGTFAGENVMPTGYFTGLDVAAGEPTYIADAQWTADLFMQFQMMAKFNKFSNAFFLHGRNYNAVSKGWVFDALNSDQKEKLAKFRVFDHVFDPLTFNELDINDTTYMIDGGSVAFASKNHFPTVGETGKAKPGGVMELMSDKWGFAFPSTIPGVFHDVTVSRTCVSGGSGKSEEFVYTFQMRTKAGLFNSPEIVSGDTGVIEIIKGDRPAESGS